jgi:uncharacterized membrane-anchored protein
MNYALQYPRFWFLYFWASLAILVASYGATAAGAFGGRGTISEVLGLAVSTLAMWPLYGYVRQKRIAPLWLWRVVLVLSGLALLLVTLLVVFASLQSSVFWVLLVPLGAWLVAGPQLFGLYQYIHRSPHIWSTSEA